MGPFVWVFGQLGQESEVSRLGPIGVLPQKTL